ncbi:MAG: methionine ABC transporter ATP-binding protein [Candidatus Nealsonbacteria bacterium]|nr:MAG: methionine ABC transporter ATP-binding protein [Candidatus Nealsonbacteria bacterium]
MLKIHNLCTNFFTYRGIVKAVDGLSLELKEGEVLGLVGESGCGKSVTLLSILGLVPYPGKITGGEVWFEGENLLKKTSKEMRYFRGNKISMIFQDPMTTLNPVFRVGEQIRESLSVHNYKKISKKTEKEKVLKLIKDVGLPSPEQIYQQYPHQLSGGMQQRILIAIALSCNPKVILADEPTTALDVTVQAQILDLLRKINSDIGTAIIMVTHDLGVVAEFCQKVAVMYAGKIVETGSVDQIIFEPKHPYTKGLLKSIPKIGDKKTKIQSIPGDVPDLAALPLGCSFHSRCDKAMSDCQKGEIPLQVIGEGRQVRCLLYNR